MLIDVSESEYYNLFQIDPNPYISRQFIALNSYKVDRVRRLVDSDDKARIGLIAGQKDDTLLSPFSAPFGGFHFLKDNQYIGEIESFIEGLKDFIRHEDLKGIQIILPPDIYHVSFNTKVVNTMFRSGFVMTTPDITSWVDLINFNGQFLDRKANTFYRKAIRNKLTFKVLTDVSTQRIGFDIILENRKMLNRPIFMQFDDLKQVEELWPVDYFGVYEEKGDIVASLICYRGMKEIAQGIFIGDTLQGRKLRSLDFMLFNIYEYYKKLNYKTIDIGISSEKGIPNEGLLRFKESHSAISSLRYKLSWVNDNYKRVYPRNLQDVY